MRARHSNSTPSSSKNASAKPIYNAPAKSNRTTSFFRYDYQIATVLLPPLILLFQFGGQSTLGIFSFCFLLLYVADLMQSTSGGVICSIFLHACVALGLCNACLPLVWHSYWNINIMFLIVVVSFISCSWSLMHFPELRQSNTLLLHGLEKTMFVVLPSVSTGIVAWGALSFFGHEHAPWITLCFACYVDLMLGNETLPSSFAAFLDTNTNKVHTRNTYWWSKLTLLLPGLFHWGLHHNVLPPFQVSFIRSTLLCDQIILFLIPVLFVLLTYNRTTGCGDGGAGEEGKERNQHGISPNNNLNKSNKLNESNKTNKTNKTKPIKTASSLQQVTLISVVIGCLLITYWYRHRRLLLHHQKSVLRLFGIVQPWDTVIVLGVPSATSLLLVLHCLQANTINMVPCVLLLYTSLLTCLGTPWTVAFLVSCVASWCSLRVYRLIRDTHGNNKRRSIKMDLFGKGEDLNSSSLIRREIIQNYIAATLFLFVGWFVGCWQSYGNLMGAGFVFEAEIMMLGGRNGGLSSSSSSSSSNSGKQQNQTTQQPIGIISLCVVGLSALLVVLLPPLLSFDFGTRRTSKIAGKLFVLHAAGTVVAECLLIPHVDGRINSGRRGSGGGGGGGMFRSTLHVVLTSLCGVALAWCLSLGKRKWFRTLPVQDSWMAACIYASKMASLLPSGGSNNNNSTNNDVGAALGTFCILATLTAPFVWYDSPAKNKEKEEFNQKNEKTNNSTDRTTRTNSNGMLVDDAASAWDNQRPKVFLGERLAFVHIIVAIAGVSVYRRIFVVDIFPCIDALTGGVFSTFIVDLNERDQHGRILWLATAPAVGIQTMVLGAWIGLLCIWHFPATTAPKTASMMIALFGFLLCVFNPSLDLYAVGHSIVSDMNLLSYVQTYTNPWTGHVFYASKVGLLGSKQSSFRGGFANQNHLWRPWVLLTIVIVLINKMATWMKKLGKTLEKGRRRRGRRTGSGGGNLTLSKSIAKEVLHFRSTTINFGLGLLSTAWLLSSSIASTTSGSIVTNGFIFGLEFMSMAALVTLFLTTFERLLVLPASAIVASNALVMYAFTLALLMFHICLVEMNAMLEPDMYVRANVHPLSTTLVRVAGLAAGGSTGRSGSRNNGRGGRGGRGGRARAVLEAGVHEIERLMAIHGLFHLLLALLIKLKYDQMNPFQTSGTDGNGGIGGSGGGDKTSGNVPSIAERMLSFGINKSATGAGTGSLVRSKQQRRNSNSSQQTAIANILSGQKVVRVIGVTSTVVCTLAVGVVCLTRSVGKYESIFVSSLVLVLLPRRTVSNKQDNKRWMAMVAVLYIYITAALNVEAFAFDVVGMTTSQVFSTSNSKAPRATQWQWWWTPLSNGLTLLGLVPLQKTLIRMLWSGGVGGRAGISGLILPMPLAVVCVLFTSSTSVSYAFFVSLVGWCYMVWRKWY